MADAERDGASIEIALIAAVAENRVIGHEGEMPWHYPADLAHFKETTTGHPVIMGRVTYESISGQLGGPLPGRTNIVLTRSGVEAPEKVVQVESADAAVEAAEAAAAETGAETAFVAGGATVYEAFLDRADRLVLTEVPGEPEGDTRFPEWDSAEWVEADREREGELSFVTYERR
ncbi:dihydrofolate reductase region [Halosimplex carlsbadense 2-9-1]|uniref:dihydrofolate reductase n=1 Tax=Halosimplex carlsbadense 2-9-1 TaxID=797114 RepID=M0D2Z7_9EURY|nr:dihydrofolate reductase [Halosimplex carlsbadense]ELZ29228.1 dihydrofolate reductase region [Halosimplex carlsbadense 2-9-1]